MAVPDFACADRFRNFFCSHRQYLKNFVVARLNPLRFDHSSKADWDETLAKMLGGAKRFDASKINASQVARSGGAPGEE